MYSLIVTGAAGAWEGHSYELEQNRVGEHTDEAIAAKYKSLSEEVIAELQSFPTLFAYEQKLSADARVGCVSRIGSGSGKVRFEFRLYPGLPSIPSSAIANLSWDLDIDKYEMNRTHWAIKAVDLLPVLVDAKLITTAQLEHIPRHLRQSTSADMPRQLVVTPTAFNIPSLTIEDDLVSVMMPFKEEFTPVFSAIQRACSDARLRCLRADNIWQETTVVQDIFNLLVRSRMVVVDFSGRNPNVMYETGIAHTLGRPVIPLSQSMEDVPFDLRHHRVLRYLPNNEGLQAMQAILAERLKTLAQ